MGDKTEEPTERKLQEAAERGQLAKSQDLTAAIDLIAAAAVVVPLGIFALDACGSLLQSSLNDGSNAGALNVHSIEWMARNAAIKAAVAAAPLAVALFIAAVLSHLSQTQGQTSGEPLKFDVNKLNPVTGVQRLLGFKGLAKSVMSVAKLAIVSVIAWKLIARDANKLAELPSLDALSGLLMIGKLSLELTIWILAVLLILGLADLGYQRWQHRRDNRMTKQEVKEEHKSMEGDPHMKSKRQKLARQIALHRTKQAVPKADVVVTNPTHFSVALKYDPTQMRAPRVVAKGSDHMAMMIRQIAREHDVPVLERPPLARALYYAVEVGQDVPTEQYQAVAEVLAYVYRTKGSARGPTPDADIESDATPSGAPTASSAA